MHSSPTLLIDTDGTCLVKGVPVPGAADALAALRAAGCATQLFTNVDSKTGEMLRAELDGHGFALAEGQVYSAIDACVAYLESHRIRSAYCLVADRVRDVFGPWACAGTTPDAVVVGDPRDCCSYDQLNTAFQHVLAGASLIATQDGRYFLTSEGAQLDTGGFVALLEHASSKQATIMGKPSRHFFAGALAKTGQVAGRVIVVGDDRETDILGAHEMGWESVLVHTGKYAVQAGVPSGAKPTWELDSVAELPGLLERLRQ